jgi:hypothetical protein
MIEKNEIEAEKEILNLIQEILTAPVNDVQDPVDFAAEGGKVTKYNPV